jgi:tetratricopeptide (TPR) repeat protein
VVQSALRGAVVRLEGKHPLAVAVKLLHDYLNEDKAEYDQSMEEMERWARNLPHVLAVVDSQFDDISINTSSMAWLVHHAGRNITSIDPRSEKYLRRAVLLYEGLYGPNHPLVGDALTELGWKLEDGSQWQAGLDVLERALELQTTAYGPDDPRVAAVMTHYASCLRGLGDSAAALPLLERALAIHEERSGSSHPAVATTLSILGMTHQAAGHPEIGKPLLERAVAIRTEHFGADHPWTATHLTNLTGILIDLGELLTARILIDRALAVREATYGPDSPTTAHSLYQLGRILAKLGDPSARQVLEAVLRIREARFDSSHPNVQIVRREIIGLPKEIKDHEYRAD